MVDATAQSFSLVARLVVPPVLVPRGPNYLIIMVSECVW